MPRTCREVGPPSRTSSAFPPLGRTEAAYDVDAGGTVRKKSLAVALIAILVCAVTGGVTGQQRPAPSRAATLDDLLEELRAFRSELRDSSATNLRGQLLLARLQLQEQRVNTIWRQLSEVEDKLQGTEKEAAAPEHVLKLMGVAPGTDSARPSGSSHRNVQNPDGCCRKSEYGPEAAPSRTHATDDERAIPLDHTECGNRSARESADSGEASTLKACQSA